MPRPVPAPDPERQLMIKTKTCQRYVRRTEVQKWSDFVAQRDLEKQTGVIREQFVLRRVAILVKIPSGLRPKYVKRHRRAVGKNYTNQTMFVLTPLSHANSLVPFLRLLKEVNYYQKEVQENEVKLQQMKDDNRDPYDVKKFAEVLDESYMMVPDSEARLAQAVHELRDFLEEETSKLDPKGEWFTTAESLLKENGASGKGPSVDAIVPETKVEDLAEGEAF